MTDTLLRYTSERPSAALIAHRIKAAGRLAEDRAALMARKYAYADEVIRVLKSEGAVKIGVKVCSDTGKYRYVLDMTDERDMEMVRISVASTYGEDAELWGITAEGTHTDAGTVF